jgi:purine-binding chemotaxis protein CheW
MSDSSVFSTPDDSRPGLDLPERHSYRALLVFQISDRFAAFPLDDVERITPMAELAKPPGLPSALEGVLNLAGFAMPVLRLDRLFRLPPQRLSLYSMLVVLRAPRAGRLAILVDRVSEVVPFSEGACIPIDREDSLNGCAEATVAIKDKIVHVLSPTSILLTKEREALADFQTMAQRRLQDWEAGQA